MTAGFVIAGAVLCGFSFAAAEDAKTTRVSIRLSKSITAVAILGLGVVSVATARWGNLVSAVVGAALVTGIQLVPYLFQPRSGPDDEGTKVGKADVRLAVPFGATLGWFGVGFAVVGYAAALLTGAAFAIATRRKAVPFVPFLTIGLLVGLVWAAVL